MTTTDSTIHQAPKWFWALSLFFLLWNIMGVFSFLGHTFISDDAFAKLPDNERELYGEYPVWTTILFAIAVLGGLAGSIGLLLRRTWAKPALIISLCAIIPQMVHNVFFTSSIEVYGLWQAVTMPVLVVLAGIFLVWFAHFSIQKKWLK